MAGVSGVSLSAFSPRVAIAPDLGGRIRDGHEARETVLWLHDYALDASSFCDLWARLPAWRHIGIDLPGHGISLCSARDEDLPALAARLSRVARARDVRHVVGLGLGSLIALQMAMDDPGAIASLTLASPWIGGAVESHLAVEMQEVLAFELAIDGPGAWLRDRLLTAEAGLYSDALRDDRFHALLERIVGAHGFWELLDGWLVRMAWHAHRREDLARVGAPTLIITGERCRESDARCAAALGDALQSSRLLTLTGTGSLALLEDPDAACAAIADHLRGASPALSAVG